MEQEGYVKCYIYAKPTHTLEYKKCAENKDQEMYVVSLNYCDKY